jgi:uncharacterized coiled-coil protein SlyX
MVKRRGGGPACSKEPRRARVQEMPEPTRVRVYNRTRMAENNELERLGQRLQSVRNQLIQLREDHGIIDQRLQDLYIPHGDVDIMVGVNLNTEKRRLLNQIAEGEKKENKMSRRINFLEDKLNASETQSDRSSDPPPYESEPDPV